MSYRVDACVVLQKIRQVPCRSIYGRDSRGNEVQRHGVPAVVSRQPVEYAADCVEFAEAIAAASQDLPPGQSTVWVDVTGCNHLPIELTIVIGDSSPFSVLLCGYEFVGRRWLASYSIV